MVRKSRPTLLKFGEKFLGKNMYHILHVMYLYGNGTINSHQMEERIPYLT